MRTLTLLSVAGVALIGLLLAAPRAEARPPPASFPLHWNGSPTQIGLFITDGGYPVAAVKVDGGTLTLPSGKIVRTKCPVAVCIGMGSSTSCTATNLAENVGENVAANTQWQLLLLDAPLTDGGALTMSLWSPTGPTTCPFWRVD